MFTSDELGLDKPDLYIEAIEVCNERAAAARDDKDLLGEGRARLTVAWALEKQGNSDEALLEALRARTILRQAGDGDWLAECCHSIGVWKFHNIPGGKGEEDFREAISARLSVNNKLRAAQVYHNLAFVLLMSGSSREALQAYEQAAALLMGVVEGDDPALSASAFKQLGFVFSHEAYAFARIGEIDRGAAATLRYFEHVEKTNAHREPVYAYIAGAISQGAATHPSSVGKRLESLTGIRPSVDAWFDAAIESARTAMVTQVDTGTGKRAYLGALLLALTEAARWKAGQGDRRRAEVLADEAIRLAIARGWHGEAARVRAVIEEPA